MSNLHNQRFVSALTLLILGLGAVIIGSPYLVWAVSPDIPHIQAAAERGSVQEEIELGAAYFMGRGVERDEKQAAYWYEKAANSGDPAAQRQIGYFYMAGIGVVRDPARAVRWFERAIAGGLMSAKVNLGVAYLWGTGVREDDSLAAKYFQEAAEKGYGPGACYMGTLYYYGKGVQKNLVEARRWYEIGSKLHDARSKHNLALMIASEDGRPSKERVAKLLRESAKAGFVPAFHQLGLFLVLNPDIARAPDEAKTALESAAGAGYWKSSVVLGIMARDGYKMPKDLSAAYVHFRIALLQSENAAAKLLSVDFKTLSSELTQAQMQSLDVDAGQWFNKHQLKLEYLFENGEDRTEFPAFALESPEMGVHAGRLLNTPFDTGTAVGPRAMP